MTGTVVATWPFLETESHLCGTLMQHRLASRAAAMKAAQVQTFCAIGLPRLWNFQKHKLNRFQWDSENLAGATGGRLPTYRHRNLKYG
jgi:hypothetical protein